MLKRILAINDISSFGKCSLTVALPVLNAMGFEVCPLPTAYLSTHTGIEGFCFKDMTDDMHASFAHYKKLNIPFDAVYSGFVANEEQIETINEFIKDNKFLKLIDPVMGDKGKRYSTYTAQMCEKMKELIKTADIITPNLTEACILLDEEYDEHPTREKVHGYLKRLIQTGAKSAVITGIKIKDRVYNMGLCDNEFFENSVKHVDFYTSGTGDLFSSLVLGYVLRGFDLKSASKKAADFVYRCLKQTQKDKSFMNILSFEKYLKNI